MTTDLARVESNGRSLTEWTEERVDLLKRTIAKGASSDELALFIAVCKRTGLDPFLKQLYFIKYRDRVAITVGIDGYRLIAERSGKYGGQLGPEWCGADGVWSDVWLANEPPSAARVGIVRKDWAQPVWATARFRSYAQQSPLWTQMPDQMLAKCAEGLAFRKAFPAELSGYRQAAPELDTDDRDIDEDGVIHEEPAPTKVRPLLDEALTLGARARALGLTPTDPPASAADAQIRRWITYWTQEVAEREAAATPPAAEPNQIEIEDAWEALKNAPPAEPTEAELPLEASGPRWAGSALGREISAVADQLEAAGKRFKLPAEDADEPTLSGWLSSMRGVLKQTTAPRS